MTIRILLLSLSVFLSMSASGVNASDRGIRESTTIPFDGQEYAYQWSNDDLHEFTPGSQSVTEQWRDMVSVNFYPVVSSGEDLAVVANAVLSNYEDAGGILLGVESSPGTDKKPSEHIIAVVFGAQGVAEFAMVKFQLHDGIGASIAYAHREYGDEVGSLMNEWMEANGTRLKDRVIEFTGLPSYADFKNNSEAEMLSQLDQAI